MRKFWILYFIIPFKSSLTLFCWNIHQFVFLTWISRCIIYHFQPIYMIISNSFAWNENFSSVCSNRGEISARFTVIKFLHIIVILFLHCCRLKCNMKSHHGLTSWDLNPDWNSPPSNQSLRWSLLRNN